MSEERKAALARGRADSRVVRNYLEALRADEARRGQTPNPDRIRSQVAEVESLLDNASVIEELLLLQRRRDLLAQLRALDDRPNLDELEREFVAIAARYADSKGISYATWREFGVEASVLKAAGIRRTIASPPT